MLLYQLTYRPGARGPEVIFADSHRPVGAEWRFYVRVSPPVGAPRTLTVLRVPYSDLEGMAITASPQRPPKSRLRA